MSTFEERRDKRHYEATKAVLKEIYKQDQELAIDNRYPTAYSILFNYVREMIVNFAPHFTEQQIAEIRIVLDQLARLTHEDTDLDLATKAKLDQLAQALRESEE